MSLRSSVNYAISALVVVLASGCAIAPDELEVLDKSFAAYESALRWQNYDVIIGFHKNERDNLTVEKRKYLKQFRVTSYNVVYSNVESGNQKASQVIEIKYYNDQVAKVRELTLNNKWEYDATAFRWQVTNDLPDFK